MVLGSSQFSILSQVPQKILLSSKVVNSDSKIIFSLHLPRFSLNRHVQFPVIYACTLAKITVVKIIVAISTILHNSDIFHFHTSLLVLTSANTSWAFDIRFHSSLLLNCDIRSNYVVQKIQEAILWKKFSLKKDKISLKFLDDVHNFNLLYCYNVNWDNKESRNLGLLKSFWRLYFFHRIDSGTQLSTARMNSVTLNRIASTNPSTVLRQGFMLVLQCQSQKKDHFRLT